MARLLADENFPERASTLLRPDHDVLTCREAGLAGQGVSDEDVLAFALAERRAVLTHNRKDFRHLHDAGHAHAGIVLCTVDRDVQGLADRIRSAIGSAGDLDGRLIRVVRPPGGS